LDQLAALDTIRERVVLEDFSHTFQHWLERSTVGEDRRNRDGVTLLSATAARGLSFRALFLLGMNEGVFPRTIHEDAFLRDPDRKFWSATWVTRSTRNSPRSMKKNCFSRCWSAPRRAASTARFKERTTAAEHWRRLGMSTSLNALSKAPVTKLRR
jgi:ATP-dependent helicase/DNAse subunit B